MLLFQLDSGKSLQVVQVCSPTSAGKDAEVEEFHDKLESTLVVNFAYSGDSDFSAKLGRGGKTGEKYISKRNESGGRMTAVVEKNKLFVHNTWFLKKAVWIWTWVVPNEKDKDEFDTC